MRTQRASIALQIVVGILAASIAYLAMIPSPIDPQPFITNFTTPYLVGALQANTKLQNIEKLFEGKILGPDSITKDKEGNFYSGLADGRIVKLTLRGEVIEIARTGQQLPVCGTYETEPKCGRPLGLKLDTNEEYLIVCDAYFGLLRVNLANKTVETIISSEDGVGGLPFGFLNDVVISTQGMIYFTDSSWKWQKRDSRYAVLEATGRGRLLSYNTATKEKKTLLRGLFIANGVELSANEEFVLVAETTASRIVRYYIQGPKQGTRDVFAENLPGYPANIISSKDGGYWLGFLAIRKWPFAFLDIVGPYPFLIRLLTKVMSQDSMTHLIPKYGMVLKLNKDGEIVDSFHDPKGTLISEVTGVFEDQGMLYLGSHKHNFLGKLRL